MANDLHDWARVKELAEPYSPYSRARLYALCREGLLPHVKDGRGVRISRQVLNEFVESEKARSLQKAS